MKGKFDVMGICETKLKQSAMEEQNGMKSFRSGVNESERKKKSMFVNDE